MDIQKFKRKEIDISKAFTKGRLIANPFKSVIKIIKPIKKQLA